jgi:hypothetical protein
MREGNPAEENSKEKSAANRHPADFRAPKRLELSPRVPGRTERTILGGHFRARISPVLSTVRGRCSNLTNVLIGEDWTIWRVDFSRAFRTGKDLREPKNLVKCDRQLFEKLKVLKSDE